MKIDTQTKLIARLHTTENGTGLNIYNPYFEAVGLNAVYMLFQDTDPARLLEGMKNLKLSGAIAAGFEHDASVPALLDELSEAAELAQRIGIIVNNDGKLRAHYQGGEGLMAAIQEKIDTTGKKIVIVGSGTVAKTLLLALESSSQKPAEAVIVNRTSEHSQYVADRFDFVTGTHSLEELDGLDGDILVNATRIGSDVEDTLFTAEVVGKYQAVVDVTFGDPHTNLITLGQDKGLITVNGWDMFTHQAAVVLKNILDHDADINLLRDTVSNGLGAVNHAKTPGK